MTYFDISTLYILTSYAFFRNAVIYIINEKTFDILKKRHTKLYITQDIYVSVGGWSQNGV